MVRSGEVDRDVLEELEADVTVDVEVEVEEGWRTIVEVAVYEDGRLGTSLLKGRDVRPLFPTD